MTTIAIDPSTKCIGWAVLDGARSLRAFGRVTPARVTASAEDRVWSMVSVLDATLAKHVHEKGDAVVEITSAPRLGKGKGISQRALIAVGAAAGAVCYMLLESGHANMVTTVTDREWTRNMPSKDRPKEKRAQRIPLIFPECANMHDPGRDIADAIGLGVWHLERNWTP